jgi:hypothetical protein
MAKRLWSWNDKALARFVAAARVGYGCWQAALQGPYPEGAQEEFAKIDPLLDEQTRALLAPLMTP